MTHFTTKLKAVFFSNIFEDSTRMRRDSSGNIRVRSRGKDQLLFNLKYPDNMYPVYLNDSTVMVQIASAPFLMKDAKASSPCYNFSGLPYSIKAGGYYAYIRLADGIGPIYYSINNCISFGFRQLRQFLRNNENKLPTSFGILSSEFSNRYGSYQISITADNILAPDQKIKLISKKSGVMEGEIVQRLGSQGSYYSTDANPGFLIKSERDFVSNDTIIALFSGNLTDVFGYKLDGNNNCMAEGSPIDDYKFTFVTPNLTEIKEIKNIPGFKLLQNYPNPFNPSTKIEYSLPEKCFVTVAVYDNLGRQVDILVNKMENAGNHNFNWEPKQLPSGVYYLQFCAGTYAALKKLLYIK